MLSAAALGGFSRAGDEGPTAKPLYQSDLKPRLGQRISKAGGAPEGSMWQFYLISPAVPKEKALRTLKVELEGKSASLAGIVQVPVLRKDGEYDTGKVNISCFISAVKAGGSVLKITPVGQDGKDWPTAQFRLEVDAPARPATKAQRVESSPDPLPPIPAGR
jgi:hypothetical protein